MQFIERKTCSLIKHDSQVSKYLLPVYNCIDLNGSHRVLNDRYRLARCNVGNGSTSSRMLR